MTSKTLLLKILIHVKYSKLQEMDKSIDFDFCTKNFAL